MTQQEFNKWKYEYDAGLRSDPPPQNWQTVEYISSTGVPANTSNNSTANSGTYIPKGSSSSELTQTRKGGLKDLFSKLGNEISGFTDAFFKNYSSPSQEVAAGKVAPTVDNLGVYRPESGLFTGKSNANDYKTNALRVISDSTSNSWWDSLSEAEQWNLIEAHYLGDSDQSSLYGDGTIGTAIGMLAGNTYSPDLAGLIRDLNQLSEAPSFDFKTPSYKSIESEIAEQLNPEYERARQRELDSFNAKNTALDEAQSLTQQSYDEQFRNMNALYNRSASNALSNQYMSNAQTFDIMQSDMRKARQNALEAGASAGLRLAGNVNALLTAQNKQSATAMDTSNALAEMLLQQRNAASGLRSDYNQYMSNYKLGKADAKSAYNSALTSIDTDYRNELSDRAGTRYDREMSDYNSAKQDWENRFTNMDGSGNPLANPYQLWLRDQ